MLLNTTTMWRALFYFIFVNCILDDLSWWWNMFTNLLKHYFYDCVYELLLHVLKFFYLGTNMNFYCLTSIVTKIEISTQISSYIHFQSMILHTQNWTKQCNFFITIAFQISSPLCTHKMILYHTTVFLSLNQ